MSAMNELTPSLQRNYAHREPAFSNVGRGEAMHQCEPCWDLLLLFIDGTASRIVLSFFFSSCGAWLGGLSWVHNLPFFTFAFPSICKPCRVRKYHGTIENG